MIGPFIGGVLLGFALAVAIQQAGQAVDEGRESREVRRD